MRRHPKERCARIMGFFRLFLSLCVLVAHFSYVGFAGIHIGVMAVCCFFIISGFVMTLLIEKYYSSLKSVGKFYLDRVVRIVPQYAFYFVVTLVAAYFFGIRHEYLRELPSVGRALIQLLIFPMNFYEFFSNADMVIPTSWTLGLEALFYLVIPFILIFRIRSVIFCGSLILFLLGYFRIINADFWTYRVLAGNIFLFICGSWIAQADTRLQKYIPWAVVAGAALLFAYTFVNPTLNIHYSRSLLFAVACGIPALLFLKDRKFLVRADDVAGNVAYGVFLNQFLVFPLLNRVYPSSPEIVPMIIQVAAASMALSYLSFSLVESPLIALRRSFRDKPDQNSNQTSTAIAYVYKEEDRRQRPL
jgi:peptidoglycan/LPS O-acetylase OafA/YrhL